MVTMRKGEKRKRDILASAEHLFYLQGYSRTTIEDMLEPLGCSKGSFYHHFDSKMQVLEQIATERISAAFDLFQQHARTDALDRLNDILYYASPFHKQGISFLSVMMSLSMQQESAVVQNGMDEARRSLFFPVLEETLKALRVQNKAFWREESLPSLVWETHTAFCHTLVREACQSLATEENMASVSLNLLRAARFQWERLLDLPFDSVRIIDAEELADNINAAYKRLKHFLPEEEKTVQTQMRTAH